MIIIINHPLVITIFMGGKNRGKNTIPSVMGNPRTAPALQRMTLGICWLWTLWPERAPKKRRVSGGPRVKKSREVLRCREPCERPAPQCRLLPMCQLTQAKADGSFQATSDFEDLDRELCLYKEALRVTVCYLPQNGHPKKSHAEAFAAALEKLPTAVLEKFPEPVLAQY